MVDGHRNTLVWPCSASVCSGPLCCARKRDHVQHSPCSRASSHRASQIMQSHRISRWSRDIEIPWCGRARICRARDRSAAPANKITFNTALVHAPPPKEHLKSCSRIESHDGRGRSKYLGVAVLGVGVLGTAVLHPQTRSRSTQPLFTRLIPQSISYHGVAYNTTMANGDRNTLVWPCSASV
jgi:hypothetical protein